MRPAAEQAGLKIKSWENIEENRLNILKQLPDSSDVLVFAYGSLMWNPLLKIKKQFNARLSGYERRFCLEMLLFRGSKSNPGVMMALDKGGFCDGVALQIDKKNVEYETKKLWAREYALGGYIPVISKLECKDTHRLFTCITFVINQQSSRYLPHLEQIQIANRIFQAKGELGSNLEYFEKTLQEIRSLNIRDLHMEAVNKELYFLKANKSTKT
ncbi:hypothetical protein SOPP22_01135 [Shewanella sp. OPT22]|nr:hypothetical protein SOPP22_01135 [Shewanella sp. OPT22]